MTQAAGPNISQSVQNFTIITSLFSKSQEAKKENCQNLTFFRFFELD